jgi:L-ribulokinase
MRSLAVGAAMLAATAAGLYPRIGLRRRPWCRRPRRSTGPTRHARGWLYDRLYQDYLAPGAFVERSLTR